MELGFQDLLFCGSGACLILFLIFSINIGGMSLAKSQQASNGDMGSSFGVLNENKEFNNAVNFHSLSSIQIYFENQLARNKTFKLLLSNHKECYDTSFDEVQLTKYKSDENLYVLSIYLIKKDNKLSSFSFVKSKDHNCKINGDYVIWCDKIEATSYTAFGNQKIIPVVRKRKRLDKIEIVFNEEKVSVNIKDL